MNTFTFENDFESIAQKLLVLFDALPDDFIQKEGISPSKGVIEKIKKEIRSMKS